MSLLATPTFTGAGTDTFYVKTGGAAGGGVATLNGLSGTVGITGSGITVGASGQNITLTATGGGVASVASANGTISVSGTTAVNVAVNPALSITSLTTSGDVVAGQVRSPSQYIGSSGNGMYVSALNEDVNTPTNASHDVGVPITFPAIITIALTATNSAGNAAGYSYRQFLNTKDNSGLWSSRNLQDNTNGITITVGAASALGIQYAFFVNGGALGTVCASSWKVERIGIA
jgi:hypothetical protein